MMGDCDVCEGRGRIHQQIGTLTLVSIKPCWNCHGSGKSHWMRFAVWLVMTWRKFFS